MGLLELSRWQFGATAIYHFLFIPLILGLAPIIAIMQTIAYKTKSLYWYKMIRFLSKVFLINFVIGTITGIVQELQVGFNWDGYAHFVGDVTGVIIAIVGVSSFFVQSTFLGLWLFGWDRFSPRLHLVCIWIFAGWINLSSYMVSSANAFMQHPVGAHYDPSSHKAVLDSVWAIVTNSTAIVAFFHIVSASWLTAATFVAAVSIFWMVKDYYRYSHSTNAALFWRPVASLALWLVVGSGIGCIVTGDISGKLMFHQQPMKMYAAESLCHKEVGPGFSILTLMNHNDCNSLQKVIVIPRLTSFLATGAFNAPLLGVEDVQQQYATEYGDSNYRPNLFYTYWSFRFMIFWSIGSAFLAIVGLWMLHKKTIITQRWFAIVALLTVPGPFIANSCGWFFTEMGRGPWMVAPNPDGKNPGVHMVLSQAVSQHTMMTMIITLIGFCIIYGIAGVFWLYLHYKYVFSGMKDVKVKNQLLKESAKIYHLEFGEEKIAV